MKWAHFENHTQNDYSYGSMLSDANTALSACTGVFFGGEEGWKENCKGWKAHIKL